MPRSLLAALAAAFLLPAAATAATPALLPPVNRTLTAPTASPSCEQKATTTYTAPISGFLSTRLTAARGDWDLFVRDATSGRRVGASQGFGATELVQGWVHAGQRLAADGCRRSGGAADSAGIAFSLLPVAPPALGPAPSLVRVRGSVGQLEALDALGLDVTESRGPGYADVIVDGVSELATLKRSGLESVVRVADLGASDRRARTADARATATGTGSALPSGRTTYRGYADYQPELKALVAKYPDLVRPVVLGKSFQGREIQGVEIAKDVKADDGRPTYFLMGVHHAREWPAGEAAMEYATTLAKDQGDPRIAKLLAGERTLIVPLVNPDGFISSHDESGPVDPADATGDPGGGGSLAEGVLPPGGSLAYRRKNCDGAIPSGNVPCALQYGVDNNRNYGALFGGPGSSPDPTTQIYHGPGPRSEPETRAVFDYVRTHEVTSLITLHTIAALVLRPPGLHDAGNAPDEARLKALGDAMGNATGYESQYGFQLYDTAGTTEDDTYAATGGYGYTIEIGPKDGQFHGPYDVNVVRQWTGDNDAAKQRGGLREALLLAGESAARPADHAVLQGSAPAGVTLRLRKDFVTKTSRYCALGLDPVVVAAQLAAAGAAIPCADPKGPDSIKDNLDAKTVVPSGGAFVWHIGQSTRPFVGAGGTKEAYVLTCERDGKVLSSDSLVIDRGQAAAVSPGCGSKPSTGIGPTGAAVTLPGGDASTPAPAQGPAVDGLRLADVSASVPTAPRAKARKLTAKQIAAKAKARAKARCVAKVRRIKSAHRRRAALKRC